MKKLLGAILFAAGWLVGAVVGCLAFAVTAVVDGYLRGLEKMVCR